MSLESFGADLSLTAELVSRIQAGDLAAWDALYPRLHDDLLFAVRCRLGDGLRAKLESADILQSVVLESLKELPTFEMRAADSLRRFLQVLVINKIRDRADTFAAQKRAGTVRLPEDVDRVVVDRSREPSGYSQPERYLRLENAIGRLPAEMREVLLLRKVDGYSSREVATRLKRSDDAIRQLLSRAMARLTLLMGEDEA